MAGGANPSAVTTANTNPFAAAAQAQGAAMNRVGQGLTGTAATGIQNYTNPYENAVVQATLRDVGNQAQMGMNMLDAQADQANAFGGSRHGIAMAELGKSYNQQALDQAAKLRQAGYNTALGAAQNDLSTQLGAASTLANMGQQAFDYGQSIQQQQSTDGALLTSLNQALIDAAKGQYGGFTESPTNALNQLISTLVGAPGSAGQLAGETKSSQPGLFSYLQVLSGMA